MIKSKESSAIGVNCNQKDVTGNFDKGDCVEIVGPDGVIARGLCNYTAEEMRLIMGHASGDIEAILGFHDFSSVIHRDNLVVIKEEFD